VGAVLFGGRGSCGAVLPCRPAAPPECHPAALPPGSAAALLLRRPATLLQHAVLHRGWMCGSSSVASPVALPRAGHLQGRAWRGGQVGGPGQRRGRAGRRAGRGDLPVPGRQQAQALSQRAGRAGRGVPGRGGAGRHWADRRRAGYGREGRPGAWDACAARFARSRLRGFRCCGWEGASRHPLCACPPPPPPPPSPRGDRHCAPAQAAGGASHLCVHVRELMPVLYNLLSRRCVVCKSLHSAVP